MRQRPPLPPGPYLVVGLGRSGVAAAGARREHGEVIACDAGRPEPAPELDGVEIVLGNDGAGLLDRVRTLVKSPGVPASARVVREARERHLEVTGELELGWRLIPNEHVAVTGTNGKTTTVELLGAIHRAAGAPVRVAGNVGTALSSLVGSIEPDATVVCEASSFQLEDSDAFAPECALLLNLSEDHLDRHATIAAYHRAKQRPFRRQRSEDVAVAPSALRPPGAGRFISFGAPDADLAHRDGELRWRGEPLMPAAEVRLRGPHNLQNAMAAAAASLARGLPAEAVRDGLATFGGVAHRLEEVARRDDVLFVNDSKATNVASARVGIEAFDGGVHLILGGSLKGGGFAELRPMLTARCRAAYLIGQAAERLAEDLAGAAPLHLCGDLDAAVAAAARAAEPGDVVLLSPACASLDSYASFESRGEHFRELVRG